MLICCRKNFRKIKADRLLLMTDKAGVNDKCGKLIEKLTISEASILISKGVITEA